MTKEQHKIALGIIKKVNTYFKVDCTTKTRKMMVVRPRMYASKLIREFTSMSYQNIGGMFGQNHDTVLNSIKQVDQDLETNPKFANYYNELYRSIESSKFYKNTSISEDNVAKFLHLDISKILVGKSNEELTEILNTIR